LLSWRSDRIHIIREVCWQAMENEKGSDTDEPTTAEACVQFVGSGMQPPAKGLWAQ
jgi:hypothetical protein